jgi:hypothetical protein
MKVTVVAPHYDDAPLSLGQSMRSGVLSKNSVTVATVFGRSNWTRWFHPTPRRTPLVTAIRLGEEAVNAARFRYKVRVASYREAVLRLDAHHADELLNSSFDPAKDPLLDEITATIRAWASKCELLLAPLGLGDHVDHLLVHAASRQVELNGASIGYYEDRPYAAWLSDAEIAARVAKTDPQMVPVEVSPPVNTDKHRRIWYPSQIDSYFLDAIALDESQHRCERVWISPTHHNLIGS